MALAVIVGLIVWVNSAPDRLLGPLPESRVLLPYQEDGLWGLLDETGAVVMEPLYDEILLIGGIHQRGDEPWEYIGRFDSTASWDGGWVSLPRRSTSIIVGYRLTERRRPSRSWPFTKLTRVHEFALYDADLTPRTHWFGDPQVLGTSSEQTVWPFHGIFYNSSPVMAHGDYSILVTTDAIAHLPIAASDLAPGTIVYGDGFAVAPQKEHTLIYGPDGVQRHVLPPYLEHEGRRGRYLVLEGDFLAGEETLIDLESGETWQGGWIRMRTTEIAEFTDYTVTEDGSIFTGHEPLRLVHLPSGREVRLPASDLSRDTASSDGAVAVYRGQHVTVYDRELRRLAQAEAPLSSDLGFLYSRDDGFAVVSRKEAEQAWVRFYDTTGTITDTWSEPTSLSRVTLQSGMEYLLRTDGDQTLAMIRGTWEPWVYSPAVEPEQPDPDDPGRLIYVAPDGQQLGESYDASEEVETVIPAADTISEQPILILTPREFPDVVYPICTIQIGTDRYTLPIGNDWRHMAGGPPFERYRDFWTSHSRTVILITRMSPGLGSEDLDMTWIFDLESRSWWPDMANEAHLISDTIIAVRLKDGTRGYRRPDGTWIKRWGGPKQ